MIAHSIHDELEAEGLGGLVGWIAGDGSYNKDGLDSDTISRIDAVIAAHDPSKRTRAVVLAELAELDALGVTRALEDLAGVLTPEARSALPEITRERLAKKAGLRAELAGL